MEMEAPFDGLLCKTDTVSKQILCSKWNGPKIYLLKGGIRSKSWFDVVSFAAVIRAAKETRFDGVVSSFSVFKRVLTNTMKHFVCS